MANFKQLPDDLHFPFPLASAQSNCQPMNIVAATLLLFVAAKIDNAAVISAKPQSTMGLSASPEGSCLVLHFNMTR